MSLIHHLLARLFPFLRNTMSRQTQPTETTENDARIVKEADDRKNHAPVQTQPGQTAPEPVKPEQADSSEPPASEESGDDKSSEQTSKEQDIMPIPQRRDQLIRICTEHLCEIAADMPETGVCPPYRLGMHYPGTQNICCITIEHSAVSPALHSVQAHALRKGTDLAVSHYMKKGTKSEVFAWLKSEEALAELRKSFDALSDAVDDKW